MYTLPRLLLLSLLQSENGLSRGVRLSIIISVREGLAQPPFERRVRVVLTSLNLILLTVYRIRTIQLQEVIFLCAQSYVRMQTIRPKSVHSIDVKPMAIRVWRYPRVLDSSIAKDTRRHLVCILMILGKVRYLLFWWCRIAFGRGNERVRKGGRSISTRLVRVYPRRTARVRRFAANWIGKNW